MKLKEKKLLMWIHAFHQTHGTCPSMAQMGLSMGCNHSVTSGIHVKALVKSGHVTHKKGMSQDTKLTKKGLDYVARYSNKGE